MKKNLSKTNERQATDINFSTTNDKNERENIFQEKPQICLIDVKNEIMENLKKNGFNVKTGTLGKLTIVPNENGLSRNRSHRCLPNHSFPENLHEYEIIVIDLNDRETIPYDLEKNYRKYVTGHSEYCIISQYPETLFNPKPFGSFMLRSEMENNKSNPVIFIVFADNNERLKYKVEKVEYNDSSQKEQVHNNYDFYPETLYFSNKFGKELIVETDMNEELYYFLKKYKERAIYHVFF